MQQDFTDPFGEGQAADIMPGTLEAPHIPDYSQIKSLKKYLRPERIYPEGTIMSNGTVITRNSRGVVEPTVLRPMYPKYKRHKIHEDIVVHSKKEEDELLASDPTWTDEPQKPLRPVTATEVKAASVETDKKMAELEAQLAFLMKMLGDRVAPPLAAAELKAAKPAELPSDVEQKAKLIAAAKERGIKIDSRWSLDRVMAELEKAVNGDK